MTRTMSLIVLCCYEIQQVYTLIEEKVWHVAVLTLFAGVLNNQDS